MTTTDRTPSRGVQHDPVQHNDTGGWELVHEQIRVVIAEAIAEVGAVGPDRAPGTRALVPWWASFSRTLAHHLHAEDDRIWPVLLRSDATAAAELRALTEEHRRIETLLHVVDRGIAALPSRLRDGGLDAARSAVLMDLTALQSAVLAHLEHEESTAVVLGREQVPPAEWTGIEQDMVKGLTLRDVSTLMPRILQNADSAARATMLGRLPAPLRLLVTRVFEPRYRAMQRGLPSHPRLPY